MDGKSRWRDSIFVERLRRSVKYEKDLHARDSGTQAKEGLARYLALYNTHRPHRTFGGKPPDRTYFDNLPEIKTAA